MIDCDYHKLKSVYPNYKNKIQSSPNDHFVLNRQKLHAFTCLQYRTGYLSFNSFML